MSGQSCLELIQCFHLSDACRQSIPLHNGPRVEGELVVICGGADLMVSEAVVVAGGGIIGYKVDVTIDSNDVVDRFV